MFLTINNNALAGRNQFSPALINRLTRYTLGGYAYDDLVKILNQQLNTKQDAELIITHHWNLRNKLKEARIRAEPTIADLKHIATEINELEQPTQKQVMRIVKNNYDKYTQLLSWNVKQKNSFFTQQTIIDTAITQANVCTDLIDLVNKEFYNQLPAITVIKGLNTEFISAENTITLSSIDQEKPIEQQLQIIKELLNKHLVATSSIRKLKDLLTAEITNMLDELNIVADNSPKNVELTKHITEVMLDLYSQYKEHITPSINLIECINEMQVLLATSVNTESTIEETKKNINSIVRKTISDAIKQQLAIENKQDKFIEKLAKIRDKSQQKYPGNDVLIDQNSEKIAAVLSVITKKFGSYINNPELQQSISDELRKKKEAFNEQDASKKTTKQASTLQNKIEKFKNKAQEKILEKIVNKIQRKFEKSNPEKLADTVEDIANSTLVRRLTASSFFSGISEKFLDLFIALDVDFLGTASNNTSLEQDSNIVKILKKCKKSHDIYYKADGSEWIDPLFYHRGDMRASTKSYIRRFFGFGSLSDNDADTKAIISDLRRFKSINQLIDGIILKACPNFCFPNSANRLQVAKELMAELSTPLIQKKLDKVVKKYYYYDYYTKQSFNDFLEILATKNEVIQLNTGNKSEISVTNKMKFFLMVATELRTPASDLLSSIAFSTSDTEDANKCFVEIITRGNISATDVIDCIENSNNALIIIVESRIDIVTKACKSLLEDELTDKQIINLIGIIEQLVIKDGYCFFPGILVSLEKLIGLTGRLQSVANTSRRLLMQQYKPLVENTITVASGQWYSSLSFEEQIPLAAREALANIANQICDKLIISGRKIIKEYSDTPRPTIDIQRALQGQSPFVSQTVVDGGFQKTVIAGVPILDSQQFSALFFNKKTGEIINILDTYVDEENKVLDKFLEVKDGVADIHSNIWQDLESSRYFPELNKRYNQKIANHVISILLHNDYNQEFMMGREINCKIMEAMRFLFSIYERSWIYLERNNDIICLDQQDVYQFILSTMLKRVGELQFLSILNHSSHVGISKVQDESQLQQLINYTEDILCDNPLLFIPAKPFAYNTEEFRRNEKTRIKQALGEPNTTVIHPDDIIKAFREIVKK